jgi:hypothetical protein
MHLYAILQDLVDIFARKMQQKARFVKALHVRSCHRLPSITRIGKYVKTQIASKASDLRTRADDNILTARQARTCSRRRRLNG